MKILYYNHNTGNFGDELNKWIWSKVISETFSGYCNHGKSFSEVNNQEKYIFYGIGTLLNSTNPTKPQKIIFGSGTGIGKSPNIDDSYKFYFVRGPDTAKALGLDKSFAITDPAILIHDLYSTECIKKYRVSFMPHYDSETKLYWKAICAICKIHYISPQNKDTDFILSEIKSSKKIITEAMHGAIVADALRVPWIPICLYPGVNEFKWIDWCKSMNLNYTPIHLPYLYSPNNLLDSIKLYTKLTISLPFLLLLSISYKTNLSKDSTLNDKLQQIYNKITQFKKDIS